MEKLLEILKSIRADIDYQNEEKLVDDGILDSFDIISIISELNDAFEIEISAEDILPENFNSVNAIFNLIKKYQEQ